MIRPIRLESSANARFKLWKRLAQEPRAVRKTGRMLLEGLHLMEAPEALDLGVDALMLDERRASREAFEAAERLSQRYPAARVFLLSGPLYDEISPVENGVGLMCEAAVPKPPELRALSRATLVYLDGVQDAGNVGTIIRSAAASGVDAVVTGPGTAAVWSPKVLRAGMGGHFALRILEGVAPEALREAYEGRIAAADARGGRDLYDESAFGFSGPVCWIFGAEGPGVSERALAVSDVRLYIPIDGRVESLNVSAAAAVCLFEMRRRRRIAVSDASSSIPLS